MAILKGLGPIPARARGRASIGLASALLLAVGTALAGCSLFPRTYSGMPLDPSAANVVPAGGPNPATLVTTAPPDTMSPGVEGSVLFIRLVDGANRTILDRPFDWPGDRQAFPPGSYTLIAYWRGCDGNCGNLSGESPFCRRPLEAAPGARITVTILPGNLAPGSTCQVSSG